MRRFAAPLVTIVLLLALAAPALGREGSATRSRAKLDTLSQSVLVQVNGVRRAHGLRPLRVSQRLTASAAQHSLEMAQRGYFAHSSADGTVFWRRIGRFYGRSGYRYWSVGENLLWSSPDVSAPRALRLWMASPEHRANLLGRTWREIGIASVHVASAPGAYGSAPVTIVTADFGVRR